MGVCVCKIVRESLRRLEVDVDVAAYVRPSLQMLLLVQRIKCVVVVVFVHFRFVFAAFVVVAAGSILHFVPFRIIVAIFVQYTHNNTHTHTQAYRFFWLVLLENSWQSNLVILFINKSAVCTLFTLNQFNFIFNK